MSVIAYFVVFLLASTVEQFGLGEVVLCASVAYWVMHFVWHTAE